MLDKDFMRDFFRWLESASNQEAEERRDSAADHIRARKITDPELVRDLKYLIRLINCELGERIFKSRGKK